MAARGAGESEAGVRAGSAGPIRQDRFTNPQPESPNLQTPVAARDSGESEAGERTGAAQNRFTKSDSLSLNS